VLQMDDPEPKLPASWEIRLNINHMRLIITKGNCNDLDERE